MQVALQSVTFAGASLKPPASLKAATLKAATIKNVFDTEPTFSNGFQALQQLRGALDQKLQSDGDSSVQLTEITASITGSGSIATFTGAVNLDGQHWKIIVRRLQPLGSDKKILTEFNLF